MQHPRQVEHRNHLNEQKRQTPMCDNLSGQVAQLNAQNTNPLSTKLTHLTFFVVQIAHGPLKRQREKEWDREKNKGLCTAAQKQHVCEKAFFPTFYANKIFRISRMKGGGE